MKKINILLSTFLTIVLLTSVSLFAKGDKCHGKKGKCENEKLAMSQEKADQLNKLKNEFDSNLDEDDLNSLIQLRETVKKEKLNIKAQISEIKSSEISKEDKKRQIKELFEQNSDNREEVKSTLKFILENNPQAVKILLNNLKELKSNLKSDRKGHKKHGKMLDNHKLARFILHDEFVARENTIKDMINNSEKLDISITQELLTFESTKESSNSTYTLYDLSGNKISTKSNQSLSLGENSVNLSLFETNIEKGRYFLVIENEHGLSAGKFIYIK